MNQAVDTYKVSFEQLSNETYTVTLPLAVFAPTDDDLFIEREKLIEHIISDLSSDLAAARTELELRQREITAMAEDMAQREMEAAKNQAKLIGQEKVIARLEVSAGAATTAALQAKQAALDALTAECADLMARVAVLEAELSESQAALAAAGDASGRAADAFARLNHSEAKREELNSRLSDMERDCTELREKLARSQGDLAAVRHELSRANESLARAEVAKKNALAAQSAQFAEREQQTAQARNQETAGMMLVSKTEWKELKELPQSLARLTKEKDKLTLENKKLGEYRSRINELEQQQKSHEAVCERSKMLLDEMYGRHQSTKMDLDYTLMLLRMFNNQPEYKSKTGRLTIMALGTDQIVLPDDQAVHDNVPVCWWNTRGGMGCIVMLSATPNEDGEDFLIFPSFAAYIEGVDGAVDIAKAVMPPKDEWPAIIEHMKKLDSAAMTKMMDQANAAAIEYSRLANPEAQAAILNAAKSRLAREQEARRRATKQKRGSKK